MDKLDLDTLPPERWTDQDQLTKKGVMFRLQLKTEDMVTQLVRTRKLSQIKLGHRTVRFCWGQVKKELACMQEKSVYQKRGLA